MKQQQRKLRRLYLLQIAVVVGLAALALRLLVFHQPTKPERGQDRPTVAAPQPAAISSLDSELIMAARQGNADRVQSLLTRGANPNAQDAKGQYAISLAAEAPVICVINAMGTNGYCYRIEKHRGYEEIVTALVQQGAAVHVRNYQGFTPLRQAQSFDEAKVVVLLRNAGTR